KNHLWLFVDGYSSHIEYENNKYIRTWGGPFKSSSDSMAIQIEYDDTKQQEIGMEKKIHININKNEIIYGDVVYKRQKAAIQPLDGLWRITGRVNENKMSTIPLGDRKTIKILVDVFLQWIAINPKEKGLDGT